MAATLPTGKRANLSGVPERGARRGPAGVGVRVVTVVEADLETLLAGVGRVGPPEDVGQVALVDALRDPRLERCSARSASSAHGSRSPAVMRSDMVPSLSWSDASTVGGRCADACVQFFLPTCKEPPSHLPWSL